MLDQRLIRENPTFVEEKLSRRGKIFDLSYLNKLALRNKDIDAQISNLQFESKKLSKTIGKLIQENDNSSLGKINEMKNKANTLKDNISTLEIKKRNLNKELLD